MPDPTTTSRLRGLVLSAVEIKELTGWPGAMVEDYLTILENLVTIAELLDVEIDQKIEEISTDFSNGSIPFAFDGFLEEENPGLTWDKVTKALNINGTITGKNRAKQYFFSGF